jgi:hypothetical protein
MTKPEFYLAPDGSLQPLPESGPLTLTDGALTYPGREEPAVAALADRKSWPQMAVGDRLTGAAASRLSINPLIGMANRTFAPMRWRGYTEGGSFVVERVA